MASLRDKMPLTAAFIDECRLAFGAEMVNTQIKLGIKGAATFHAEENGIKTGTPIKIPVKSITGDKMVIYTKAELLEKSIKRNK